MWRALIEYFANAIEAGLSKSTMNTLVTSVTQVVAAVTGVDINQSQVFLMAKRHMTRKVPRSVNYHDNYDIDLIWAVVDSWPINQHLSMEELRSKMIILMKLDTMCRNSDLARLYRDEICFRFDGDELLIRFFGTKERPHAFTDWISIQSCEIRQNICTVAAVKAYLARTNHGSISKQVVKLRKAQLHLRPLVLQLERATGVSEDLISKMTKRVLTEAGIPPEFDAHSTRSASISKAVQLGVSQDRVQLHAR